MNHWFAFFKIKEFDYGPEELLKRVNESKFSWLGTNIRDKDGNAFPNLKNEHIIQVKSWIIKVILKSILQILN